MPVEQTLRDRHGPFAVSAPDSAADTVRAVQDAIAGGAETIVAAGGDGTVNTVLNALIDPVSDRPRAGVALGAIGLGSSNDAHKPFQPEHKLAGAPVRISRERSSQIDVGRADVDLGDAGHVVRYFLLNASVGVIAESNAYFNRPGPMIDRLKRMSVEAAIVWSGVRTVATFESVPVTLRLDDGAPRSQSISAAGILKSVHFAGGMRYDTPVACDDGTFAVNVFPEVSKAELLGMIPRLYAGGFRSHPKSICAKARTVHLSSSRAFALELDGEVYLTCTARLTVVPRVLRWCGC